MSWEEYEWIKFVWTQYPWGSFATSIPCRRFLRREWDMKYDDDLSKELAFSLQVEQYASQQNTPVMIISYEMFLRSSEAVEKLGFDLIVCDEAHRLKNPAIKTTHLLASLPCKKRILLTGTPIQNDLQVSTYIYVDGVGGWVYTRMQVYYIVFIFFHITKLLLFICTVQYHVFGRRLLSSYNNSTLSYGFSYKSCMCCI